MKKTFATLFAAFCLSFAGFAQSEGYTVHIVKWFEDLTSISARYGVPVDVLKAVNNLGSNSVTTRQQLLIPVSEKYWQKAEGSASTEGQETTGAGVANARGLIEGQATTVVQGAGGVRESFTEAIPTERISLGVVLPFTSGKLNQRGNVVDFYSGLLLGVKEMGEKGLDIVLNVHDLADAYSARGEANDIIVGPFHLLDFEKTAQALGENQLVLSPLDQKVSALAAKKQNIIQIPVAQADLYDCMSEWEEGNNYIIVRHEADTAAFNDARRALERKGISYHVCSCSVQGEIQGWEMAYMEEGINKVILAITNEAILNNAVRNMCIEESKGNVLCYAGSKLIGYSSIPVENIHRAHMHVACSYYVDYKDEATRTFLRQYRTLFNREPSQYAFQGHDIAVFLLSTYSTLGKAWPQLIDSQPQMDILQSSFKLERLKNGGLANKAVRKVEYQRNFKIDFIKDFNPED